MEVIVLPLGLALEALAGALMIAAAIDLGILTRDLFRRLPWPVYLVAEATYAAVVGSIGAVVGWSVAGAENAARTLRAVLVNPWVVHQRTSWAIGDIASALQVLRQVTIPYFSSLAQSYAWGWVQAARADAAAATNALFWTAYNWVQGLFQWAQAGIAGAELSARQGTAAAIQHADQVGAGAIRHADQAAAAAALHADQLAAQDIAYTRAVGAEALAYAHQVGVAAETLTQQVEQGLVAREDRLARDLTGYAQALTAAAVATAAAATGAMAARVAEIEDSPCQRFCGPLGDLGQALQELQDLGLVGAILALAAESARDAAGAGRGLAADLGPVARDFEASVRGVVGP